MKSAIVGITLLVGSAQSLLAQAAKLPDYKITVSGTVRSRDGELLKGAEIIAGELHAVTGDSGSFTLPGIPGGSVLLVIRRIGYIPGTLAFESQPELRALTVAATLVPTAVTLGTIVVEGKTLDQGLWKNGFYRRQNLGMGVYFDPERMARTGMNLSSVVTDVPTIRVERRPGGVAIPTARSGTGYCALNVYLDGSYLPWATQLGIDNVIAPGDVKAMEIYPRANEVPMTFTSGASTTVNSGMSRSGMSLDGGNIECGVIMIWTKSVTEVSPKK